MLVFIHRSTSLQREVTQHRGVTQASEGGGITSDRDLFFSNHLQVKDRLCTNYASGKEARGRPACWRGCRVFREQLSDVGESGSEPSAAYTGTRHCSPQAPTTLVCTTELFWCRSGTTYLVGRIQQNPKNIHSKGQRHSTDLLDQLQLDTQKTLNRNRK